MSPVRKCEDLSKTETAPARIKDRYPAPQSPSSDRRNMDHIKTTCRGPVSRRDFLRIGTLGIGGFSLVDFLRLRGVAGPAFDDPDTSVIFVWLPGGPPHMETFDMKPDAPADYRGIFHPIATNVPGIDICELMPRLARVADRFTLIRSISHGYADHGGGHKRLMTGRKPKTPVNTVNDAPAVGSFVAKWFENRDVGLPNYICNAPDGRHQVDTFAMGAAWLGPSYVPFTVPGNPADDDFEVKNLALSKDMEDRLDDRTTLLNGFDRFRSDVDGSGLMDASDRFRRQALDLLTSSHNREAFDLSQEPDDLRDRYGRHSWGQRALLARRLVEAGAKFVTMVMENPYKSGIPWLKNGTYNWDSHAVNCHIFDDAKVRIPLLDRAIAALVEDLYDRGLDRKVLLVVTGEFGRTPRITVRKGTQTKVDQPGRDHWPQAMSVLVSGGGMPTGQAVGSTNAKGEHPHQRPLGPEDLWATVYGHLGINIKQTWPDHNGRPMYILPSGSPINELMG